MVEDDEGGVISTPTIRQVQKLELNIRKKAAELRDEGADWWAAILTAREDPDLKANFQQAFSVHVSQPSNRSVTAPGLASVAAPGPGRAKRETPPPPAPRADPRPGKRARRTENRKKQLDAALAKAKADGAAQAAAAARRDGKGAGAGRFGKGDRKGAGRGGKGAGMGAGKADALFPDGAMRQCEADKKAICASFNKGSCTHPNCKFAHTCWWCGETDHAGNAHEGVSSDSPSR